MKVLRSGRNYAGEVVAVVDNENPGWRCSGVQLVSGWQTYDAGERGNEFKVVIKEEDLVSMIQALASSQDPESLRVLDRVSTCVVASMHARIQGDARALEQVELEHAENRDSLEKELEATKFIATHLWHKAHGYGGWGASSMHAFFPSWEWNKVKKRLPSWVRSSAKKIAQGEQ
jgi:hypothetical protein